MKRSPWPFAIAGGLGFAVLFNLGMVAIAVENAPVLESDRAYQAGLEYEGIIAERRASHGLGWTVEVDVCGAGLGPDGCALTLHVQDAERRPVAGLRGRVEATRADDARLDAWGPVTELGDGRYAATVPLRRGGLWRVATRLEGPAGTWIDERRASVQP